MLLRDARNGKQAKNLKWKYVSPAGIEQATLAFEPCALDPSATLSYQAVLNFYTIMAFNLTNTHDVQCMYQIDYGLVCSCKVL